MSLTLNNSNAFVSTLRTTDGTFAFLVGAPISQQDGQGVPDVKGLLERMRAFVSGSDALDLGAFDAAVGTGDAGSRYQNAVAWVLANAGGIGRVNQFVRDAVLEARRPGAPDLPPETDGEPGDWFIPQGVRDLAALVCSGDPRFHGPILTTNFDPLIELAIYEASGRPETRWITRDATLGGVIPAPDARQVIHLHGFWRKSDTLHTAGQLEARREKLKRSLQHVLRNHRLVAVSYGGWNDVFTEALTDLIEYEETADVLWGFYSGDEAKVAEEHATLLERVEPALGTRFVAYGGIDVHHVFGEVAAHLLPDQLTRKFSGDPAPVASPVAPLTGWETADDLLFDSLPALTDGDAIRFFDGVVPTWRHALSDAIPRRERVGELLDDLDLASTTDGGGSSLHLVLAASGEGKSTVLLQTAVDVARRDGWRVVARPAAGIPLDPDEVLALDGRGQWLLVSDDAEELVGSLKDCADALNRQGKKNVHFLLAARGTDWQRKGRKVTWENWLRFEAPRPMRGVSEGDATALVAAWQDLGDGALGALARVEPAERVAAFQRAVSASGGGNAQGSLLGGLLNARFGAAALRAHLRSLLERLQSRPLRGSPHTLYDALVYIAACHCGTGPGLSLPVLADLLKVDRQWVNTEVLSRLGEEAVAVGGAETARTRHPRIAEAVVQEAEAAFGTDLAEVWAAIVRQTVETEKSAKIGESFSYIVHAGPKLACDLPHSLPDERLRDIAVAAAQAAIDARPERLDQIVDLALTHRMMGQPAEGAAVLRYHRDAVTDMVDYEKIIRGYWNDWGASEGMAGRTAAGAWIAGLSLSDHLAPAVIRNVDIKISCAGLGAAFRKLAAVDFKAFAHPLRAAPVVGRASLLAEGKADPYAEDRFSKHQRQADALGVPHPANLPEAVDWLIAGIRASHAYLGDPELSGLNLPEAVTFSMLRVRLGFGDDVGGQRSEKATPPKPRPPHKDRDPASTR